MIIVHALTSFLIYVIAVLPATIASWPLLACMLLTKWDGTTYFFGNSKYPRSKAATHYADPTEGKYWKELLWYGKRNPVYNLNAHFLAIKMRPYTLSGNENIGDKIRPGFYAIKMGWAWEYYWVHKYFIFGKWRCVRVRFGWKIANNLGATAACVFVPNPVMSYKGV